MFESLLLFSDDGSDIDDLFWIGSHSFCWGFVWPLSFWFLLSLSFLPELFPFLELQSAGCPSFVSLLHGFWLNGFFIFWDNDCLSLLIIRNHHCLSSFCKDLFGAICYALGSTERLPCPRLWLRVLNFEKKNSYFFGSEGLTRDYLPYNSSV